MGNKWYLIIILIINKINAQHPEHVEVFLEITSVESESFSASADAPTYVPPDNSPPNDNPLILGTSSIVIEIDPNSNYWEGFNLLLECYDGDCGYPIMRYGIYKIWVSGDESNYFYYDTRDCNYMTYNFSLGGTPDVTFRYYSGSGFLGWYGGTPNSNINVYPIAIGDTLLFSEVWKENSPSLPSDYVSDLTCFEAEVNLINLYDDTDIQDIIFVNEEPIPSNSESVFPRGIELDLRSKQVISYLNIDKYHHNWGDPITSNNNHLLEVYHTPDGDVTINNIFNDVSNSTISTSISAIPISIQDPWYVDGNGDQLNEFHELNVQENPGGSYDVFKNEGNLNEPDDWEYAVSVPVEETVINGGRYIFDSWVVSGAEIAPYPGDESNRLKKKVLFTGNNPTVTACYLNLSALEGDIYSNHTLNGTINVVGDVTIQSGADITFSPGTIIRFNPYKRMNVYGTLTADGSAFTRSDPNSTSRTFWWGIYGKPGSTVLLTNSTLEGAFLGLIGTTANVRAINSTFNQNYYGMYLSHCTTYYSHDNLFTDNNYGIYLYSSNVPLHNNIITNNMRKGILAVNSSGNITGSTITNNGQIGLQAGYHCTVALKECDYGGEEPVNNIITNNGDYGIYIDYNSTPDLGTYFVDSKGWTYGGYNTFHSSANGLDIKSYNSSRIYAQMNWWETQEIIGNVWTIPEAGGGGPLPKTITSDFPIDSLQLAAVMTADSLYAAALNVYRLLLNHYPDYRETALVIGKIMETYRTANRSNDDYSDITLITELESIYTNLNTSLAGLFAYDHSIAIQGMNGQIMDAIVRCDEMIDLYENTDTTYTENIAYVMYEQGQLLESLPDSLNGQGKLLALPAPEEVYQQILNDYPNSQAAELVRMGRIESEDYFENDLILESFTLYPAYPNPFNPITTIKYDLPQDSRINLNVYNIMGQEIKTLTDEIKHAGVHTVTWNGTNRHNEPVSSGMYFVRMVTPNSVLTQKIVLMK